MSEIFTSNSVTPDYTHGYDGSGSPAAGVGVIKVNYACNKKEMSRLQLFTREASTTHAFKCVKECYESEEFKADVTGDEYYFVWKLLVDNTGDRVVASLAVS